MVLKFILLFVFVFVNGVASQVTTSARFPIVGIFNNQSQQTSIEAFENIAPTKEADITTYHGRYLISKALDSYSTALELCKFTSDNKGFTALIDARPTQGFCDTICLLCNKYNIPHLSLGWEPIESLKTDEFTFSYHPPPDIISKAFTELTKHLGYDKFTIFYEDESSFIRLQDVINSWSNTNEPIVFAKLDPEGDNKEIFKHIFKVEHMTYHIIDCDIDNILKYFGEITQVDDATKYQSFILSNLDAYLVDLSNIPELNANVSTLHLTTAESMDKWRDYGMSLQSPVRLETALEGDALHHLERSIKGLLGNDTVNRKFRQPPGMCFQEDYSGHEWPLGLKLRNSLRETKDSGFTGNIEFDPNIGRRINFELHFSKLNRDSKFVHVGKWASKTNILESSEDDVSDRASNMEPGAVVRIATRKGEPYVFVVEDEEKGTMLRGYAVDLIEEIFEVIRTQKKVDLKYELKRVENDEYGKPMEGTKKWSGIIGQLIDHKADMGICDLTITSDRNAVIDFSIPFMTLGISMLSREREVDAPKMFSFLLPLSFTVWLYLVTTFIIVSFILLICARMSQDDWVNPHPCNQNPENLQNIWSFYNCMWLCMGAIMCQGCDILPRSAGSRWISGMWWFFALIVTSSYTANMSAFLSEGRRNEDIKNVEDLTKQTKVSYGAVVNASTYTFFKHSNDTVYQKLWSVMSTARPTVFANNNDEGMGRVKRSKGNYVFFMESTSIEYYVERDCVLKMLESKLDSKEYGIGFPKSSPYRSLVDFAILYLQETGRLELLKTKWWETEYNDAHCKEKKKNVEEDNGSLKMKNTSGIFLVLGAGGILGLLVAVIDFLLNAEDISMKEKISFREALLSEWRASLNPKAMHKPAAPQRSAPPSTASPSPHRERSQSRAVSVLRAASSFINFDEIY